MPKQIAAKDYQQLIKNVFNLCQDSPQTHKRVLGELFEIYQNMAFKEFTETFLKLLRYFLIKWEPSSYVDNCLLFVAKFAVCVPVNKDAESEDDVSQFVRILLENLMKISAYEDKAVRLRSCQLICNLLTELIQTGNGNLTDEMWQRLLKVFLERAKDKVLRVRVQAVAGLARLQDADDKNCPATTALMFLSKYDPSVEVRVEVVKRIVVNNLTLPAIVERTLDESDLVRRQTFLLISSKIPPKYLSIKQRCELLQNGLTDRQEIVRKSVQQKLVPSWQEFFDNDICEFLTRIDLVNNEKTAELTLRACFEERNLTEIVDEWKSQFLDDKILLKNPTSAKSFYWRHLVKYVHFQTAKSPDNVNLLDLFDRILPSLSDFSDFLLHYVQETVNDTKDDINKQVEYEFVTVQLFFLLDYFDVQDEAGRKALKDVLHRLVADVNTNPKCLASIIRILFLMDNVDRTVTWLAEVISEFHQPSIDCTLKQSVAEDAAESSFTLKNAENERNDATTLAQCLTITSEILQNAKVKTLSPILRSLLDNLVLKCIQNEDPVVRNLAFRCLGLCCILEKNLAVKYFVVLVQAMKVDVEAVKKTAAEGIFDLLTLYGTEIIDSNFFEGENIDKKNLADGILKILSRLLVTESDDLRNVAAEGFAKLLFHQRFYAPLLLSRLILLWYNPITKDSPSLRQCIGCFLPMFAFASLTNQEALEEAFVPTLRTLISSPFNHPLATVDVENVALFMVRLTSCEYLSKGAPGKQEGNVHGSLAIKICHLILNDCQQENVKTLAKTLCQLSLKPNIGLAMLKDIQKLVSDLLQRVKEKRALKCLEQFAISVKALISETAGKTEKNNGAEYDATDMANDDVNRKNKGIKRKQEKSDNDIDSLILEITKLS